MKNKIEISSILFVICFIILLIVFLPYMQTLSLVEMDIETGPESIKANLTVQDIAEENAVLLSLAFLVLIGAIAFKLIDSKKRTKNN